MPGLARPGVTLHYDVRGRGAPLLLIAGLASDSLSWLTVAEPLASRYRTIAPDNRGVGRTVPQDVPVDVDTLADDCAALLDHLGIERASVIGHSMGGFVAQRLALRHPHHVERLVLVATGDSAGARNVERFFSMADRLDAGEDRATWLRSLFDAIFTRRFLADPANVDAALHWALEYPYPQSASAFRRQCEGMAGFDGRAELVRIARPALVVAGREDALFSPDQCAAFAARLPGAKVVVLDGAAHAVHTEQPKAFVDAVARFLEG
ncbi:MAG: alpha/beta fold hydrolase [Vicinamibacteria bacterium]|jgi:pimeloyl-ACP methyl ester carboxylesterase